MQAGTVSDQTICFTDLLATFADIVGARAAREAGPDSFSFLPVLLDQPAEGRPVRASLVVRTGLMTIRSGPWKLIAGLGSGGFSKPRRVKPGPGDPEGQLYNLDDDLGETRNLYADRPEIVARLKQELARIRDSGRSRP